MWRFLLLAALAAPTPPTSPAPSPAAAMASPKTGAAVDSVVQRLQARYDTTRDLTADVVQEMEISSFGRKLTSKGTVYFKRPGRMRWDLNEDQHQTIVADGTYLWMYQPSEHQVYKAPFGAAFQSTTPVSFLTGMGRLAEDFTIFADGEEGSLLYLRLVPRAGEGIGTLRLGVDKKSYDILSAEVRDPIGNVTRLQFSNLKRDTGLEDSLFQFHVPQGAEVVEPPAIME